MTIEQIPAGNMRNIYCRVSDKMKGCGSLQTSSWLDSDVLRNRQLLIAANRYIHIKKDTASMQKWDKTV